MIDNFKTICDRIKNKIGISKDIDLIKIIGTSQPTFSRRKKDNKFDYEWAFIIGTKYNLLSEWILTGKEPCSLNDLNNSLSNEFNSFPENGILIECQYGDFTKNLTLIPGNFYIIDPINPRSMKNRGVKVELIDFDYKEGAQVLLIDKSTINKRVYDFLDPCDLKEI